MAKTVNVPWNAVFVTVHTNTNKCWIIMLTVNIWTSWNKLTIKNEWIWFIISSLMILKLCFQSFIGGILPVQVQIQTEIRGPRSVTDGRFGASFIDLCLWIILHLINLSFSALPRPMEFTLWIGAFKQSSLSKLPRFERPVSSFSVSRQFSPVAEKLASRWFITWSTFNPSLISLGIGFMGHVGRPARDIVHRIRVKVRKFSEMFCSRSEAN